jgi:hypothetical protein
MGPASLHWPVFSCRCMAINCIPTQVVQLNIQSAHSLVNRKRLNIPAFFLMVITIIIKHHHHLRYDIGSTGYACKGTYNLSAVEWNEV